MAEVLCDLLSGTVVGLENFGFINVPKGTWVAKTGSKSISAKDPNIIPLCGESYAAFNGNYGTTRRGTGYGRINGHAFTQTSGNATDGNGYVWIKTAATTWYAFYPAAYNMDLTAVQNSVTSAKMSCWLEKK